jgi:hypothetical protein
VQWDLGKSVGEHTRGYRVNLAEQAGFEPMSLKAEFESPDTGEKADGQH